MNREGLLDALSHALGAIDLRARVSDALRRSSRRPVRVLAIGKAAGAMLAGALDVLERGSISALAIVPDGVRVTGDPCVLVLRSAHPVPDERSVHAGETALAFHPELVLVSGGTSSLGFVPVGALERAREALGALLASSASVHEVNVVRRHASRFHGGALGALPTLLASDVIGGAPHDIGSGPTVADPTTRADAERILAAYAPNHVGLALRETRKPDARAPDLAVFVSEPEDLARAVATALQARGLHARVLPSTTASVTELAREYVALAATLTPRSAAVRSAEPSLRVDVAGGRGGRCSHLAAVVAADLPPGVLFLAAASDGVDGASGTAGALVSRHSFADRQALQSAIAAFDTGLLHLAAGTALPLAPTGVNLADVHVLARF